MNTERRVNSRQAVSPALVPPELDDAMGNAALDASADAEELARQRTKETVGARIMREAPGTAGKSLDDLMNEIAVKRHTSAEEVASLFGIVKKENGKYHFKVPGRSDLPGMPDNEDVMKGILAKVVAASSVEERWRVATDVFAYFGVDVSSLRDIQVSAYKENGPGLLEKLKKSIPKLALPLFWFLTGAIDVGLTAASISNNDNGRAKIVGEKNPGRVPGLEALDSDVHVVKKGENLWTVARGMFADAGVASPTDEQIRAVSAKLGIDNDVDVAQWGVAGGTQDTNLPEGTRLNLDDARGAVADAL